MTWLNDSEIENLDAMSGGRTMNIADWLPLNLLTASFNYSFVLDTEILKMFFSWTPLQLRFWMQV